MVLACSHAYAAGYVRKDWPHWEDLDADCQNTRAEILIRDSRVLVQFKGEVECRVVAGEWFDPYTGQVFTSASEWVRRCATGPKAAAPQGDWAPHPCPPSDWPDGSDR